MDCNERNAMKILQFECSTGKVHCMRTPNGIPTNPVTLPPSTQCTAAEFPAVKGWGFPRSVNGVLNTLHPSYKPSIQPLERAALPGVTPLPSCTTKVATAESSELEAPAVLEDVTVQSVSRCVSIASPEVERPVGPVPEGVEDRMEVFSNTTTSTRLDATNSVVAVPVELPKKSARRGARGSGKGVSNHVVAITQ